VAPVAGHAVTLTSADAQALQDAAAARGTWLLWPVLNDLRG
jgi:hypothetical protein